MDRFVYTDADGEAPTPSSYAFRGMTLDDASAIMGWRYDPPYDFYNGADADQIDDVPAGCVSVVRGGELCGFLCFGEEGQVPGCERRGCYHDEALDVGFGMRPDLTGRGHGQRFVQACLTYAMERFVPRTIRLTVALFNERAISVYRRVGFTPGEHCSSPVRGVDTNFLVMRRTMGPAERESNALSR